MSLRRMCGVVLWSNPDDRKAVIWCEDQGNLAYYVEPDHDGLNGVSLDAGDLIEFELREERQLRRATNPTLLCQDAAPGIARELDRCANRSEQSDQRATDNVVPFRKKEDWYEPMATHVTA